MRVPQTVLDLGSAATVSEALCRGYKTFSGPPFFGNLLPAPFVSLVSLVYLCLKASSFDLASQLALYLSSSALLSCLPLIWLALSVSFLLLSPFFPPFAMSTEQKPLSWWKRHCTPPPAINRTPQCPCSACWNGNGEHWSTAAPQTAAPTSPRKETRTSALRRETESDLTPLRRVETSSTTSLSVSSQETRSSLDRVSVTNVHQLAQGKEVV